MIKNIAFEIKLSFALGLQILRHRYSDAYLAIFWFYLSPIAFPFIIYFFLPMSNSNDPSHLFNIFSGYAHWFLFCTTILIFLRAFRPLKRYFINKTLSFFCFFSAILLGPIFQAIPLFILLYLIRLFTLEAVDKIYISYWIIASINTILFSILVGMLLAIVNLKTRDIKFGVPYILTALTFVFPIFYSLPKRYEWLYQVVPIVTSIELTRVNPLTEDGSFWFFIPFTHLTLIVASIAITLYYLEINRERLIITMLTLNDPE